MSVPQRDEHTYGRRTIDLRAFLTGFTGRWPHYLWAALVSFSLGSLYLLGAEESFQVAGLWKRTGPAMAPGENMPDDKFFVAAGLDFSENPTYYRAGWLKPQALLQSPPYQIRASHLNPSWQNQPLTLTLLESSLSLNGIPHSRSLYEISMDSISHLPKEAEIDPSFVQKAFFESPFANLQLSRKEGKFEPYSGIVQWHDPQAWASHLKQGLQIAQTDTSLSLQWTGPYWQQEERFLQQLLGFFSRQAPEAQWTELQAPGLVSHKPVYPKKALVLVICSFLTIALPTLRIQTLKYIRRGNMNLEYWSKKSPLPVIGIIPSQGIFTRHHAPLEADVIPVFQRSMQRLLDQFRLSQIPKVLAVTSFAEAEGKSFCAFHLAAALAERDKKIVLLELDIYKPSLRKYVRDKHLSTLASWLNDPTMPMENMLIPTEVNGLFLILAKNKQESEIIEVKSQRMEELVRELRTKFDHLVVDTAPWGKVKDFEWLIHQTDFTCFVVRPGYRDVKALNWLKSQFSQWNLTQAGILINGIKPRPWASIEQKILSIFNNRALNTFW
ncbi:MAG: P-loop NTPase [Bacteroidota bacterium]